ncbi:MAG: Crp/Fnr family transcriptional regulator [Muribaculaceae bacterium]|nr:Crp/Fnr family transcriptional regulator [Bacteroidales bacterium]MDY4812168.1 Crp/Fnr family transcriptional regulator [Muribaculaceae bacterium]
MNPIEHIRSFTTLTPEVETELKSLMQESTYSKGQLIRGANNLLNYAYYIISGSARLFYTNMGKEYTVSFIFDDEYIVAPKIYIENQPDTISIEFLENTTVIYVPHIKVKDILEGKALIKNTSGLLFLNVALMRYNDFLEERMYMMQNLNATQRYNWLIRRHPRILQAATVTQIASYLGLTKETLYRIRHNNY